MKGNKFTEFIKDKFFLLVILLVTTIDNLPINIPLVIIIIYMYFSDNRDFLGPVTSAFLTFNLINSYSYYRKLRNWNKNKKNFLLDLEQFINNYIYCLQYEKFPLIFPDTDEYKEIDAYAEKRIWPTDPTKYSKVLNKYEKYFRKMICNNDTELSYDDKRMREFIGLFITFNDKIINTILITAAIFSESNFLIAALNHFRLLYEDIIMHQREGLYNNDRKYFLDQMLKLIDSIKSIDTYIMNQNLLLWLYSPRAPH